MDKAKLTELRARYADRDVFDNDDPVLAEAARQVQSVEGKRSLPYSGVPTFLDLPYADLPYAPSAVGLDIALVGVPMDLGVSNRPGARFGPRSVRSIERIGPYHPTFRVVPKGAVRAADVGDVPAFEAATVWSNRWKDIRTLLRCPQGTRRASIIRRRRPFHHLSDPQGLRQD